RFFAYTRAGRDDAIRPVLEGMAGRRNCRLWYSCDRQTGIPERVPPRVRLAWLMSAADELPPTHVDLIFRTVPLRRRRRRLLRDARVCPAEDSVPRRTPATCERCRLCWAPLPDDAWPRLPLPVLPGES
ncbi:MAG TPA: hypothetical protein VHF26_02930, partial [Trebonia sp.]|nr:hypothetical protein [Trebonia sp.]